MHDSLTSTAFRRAWLWVAFLVSIPALIPAALFGLISSSWSVAAILWLVIVASSSIAFFLPEKFVPSIASIKAPTRPAEPWLQSRAAGICAALGIPELPVTEIDHQSLNIGVLGSDHHFTAVVTSGAIKSLTAVELESAMATMIASRTERRMARLVAAVRLISVGGRALLALGFLTIPAFFIGIPLAHALAFWGVALILLNGRLLWWLRIATDGVTVATTRFPEPLTSALCKIALYNGPGIPISNFAKYLGTYDQFWLTAPSNTNAPLTTSLNDRPVAVTSSEMDSDLRLLMSAKLVTDVCINQQPATVEVWRDCETTIKNARKSLATENQPFEIGNYLIDTNGLRINNKKPAIE